MEAQYFYQYHCRNGGLYGDVESYIISTLLTTEDEEVWEKLKDTLFRDVWNIPVMEKIIKERFNGKYPVRKSIQTEFAHVGGKEGLQFQVDAVAYCGK